MNQNRSTKSRIKNKETGFTLVEVIVAISILTVGLLAIASMQSTAIQGNYFASRMTEGTSWAQDKIEELVALPYTDPDLSAGAHTEATPPTGYTVTWNVADDNPVTNTKLITVTVTPQGKGASKPIQLTYIKASL
jgi:type IV pilus assembly protein PilV